METSQFTTHPSPASPDSPDIVSVRALTLTTHIGHDVWYRNRPQPIIVSLSLYTDISKAGTTDDLGSSIHYGTLTKAVSSHITEGSSDNLLDFVNGVAECCFLKGDAEDKVKIIAELPEALTMAEGVGIEVYRQRYSKGPRSEGDIGAVPGFGDALFVRNLRVPCIIGVNDPERTEKQIVVVNLRFWDVGANMVVGYRNLIQTITGHIEASRYLTIEAMVTAICRISCVEYGVNKITVRVEKPSALTFARGAAVEITRRKEFFAGGRTPAGFV
ncbi:Dihydroneopterin aldolase-domain-containing protein [Kalaharituber pfeilii]|nr:Dihydroneopterin aldolase-domain-containing protein [Kalaharituber pfeilii]